MLVCIQRLINFIIFVAIRMHPSGDAAGGHKSASQIARNVLDNVGKYNNSVILFHDAAGKDSTVDALPMIIEAILESDNTVILPISKDTVRVQHLHK